MAMTTTEKRLSVEEQIKQLENQRKLLIQKEKEQARKERTHRLCKRGGLFENVLPETIPLSDEQFQIFINKVLLSDFARKTLESLAAQSEKESAEKPAGKETHAKTAKGAKPAEHGNAANADNDTPTPENARAEGQ